MFADDYAEETDERDDRRCRRFHLEQRVQDTDDDADRKRDDQRLYDTHGYPFY